jgi:hypothetical protein
MGRVRDGIDGRLGKWLETQPVFFVATAPTDRNGHLNLSPKGNRGELAVLDAATIAYLDQTGSGIETLAHLCDDGRIVMMACAFEGAPRIVRLHGRGRTVRPGDPGWGDLAGEFVARGGDPSGPGVRCAVVMEVARVADSCGYGVPLMDFAGHRPAMDEWAAHKGPDGIASYRSAHNTRSLDGLPGIT